MMRGIRLNIFGLLIAVIATALGGSAATPTAADILAKAQKEIKNSAALRGTFSLAFDGRRTDGEIMLSGNRFRISTPEMTTWFDGKTQWSLSNAANEVNISEPTPGELEQINPFAIVESMRKEFKARRLESPAGAEKIELTPTVKSDYSKVVLTLDSSTSLPREIVVTTSDGSVTTIRLQHLEKIKAPAITEFRFDPKEYPLADIIDLR